MEVRFLTYLHGSTYQSNMDMKACYAIELSEVQQYVLDPEFDLEETDRQIRYREKRQLHPRNGLLYYKFNDLPTVVTTDDHDVEDEEEVDGCGYLI